MAFKTVLIREKTHPSIPRRNPVEKIEEAISRHSPDLIVAPEYFMNNERSIYTRAEKEGLVQRIADISGDRLVVPGTILWQEGREMRNTVVAVNEGKVIAEHDKSVDGGDTFIAQTHGISMAYGGYDACVFEWNGHSIGLEICIEHGLELLKGNKGNVDLQIVASCGGCLMENSFAIKNNGYAICCDGKRPHSSKVMRRSGLIVPDYERQERESNDNAFIYSLFPEGR